MQVSLLLNQHMYTILHILSIKKLFGGVFFMKKIISSLVSLAITFTFTTSVFASSAKETAATESSQVQTITTDIYTDNDVLLGKLTTSLVYKRKQKEDAVEVTLTTTKHYDLNKGLKNNPRYKDSFSDSSNNMTIKVANRKGYYVNDKKLSAEELNQSFNAFESNFSIATTNDTGGVPELGHYYSTNGTTNYYFATYSGMTMGGDPEGNHVVKNTTRSNSYFNQAANTLDILYGDHQSYLWAKAQISAAIVAFPFTVASVLGAIADGGAIGLSAAQLYSAYRDCNSDLDKAYNLISQI